MKRIFHGIGILAISTLVMLGCNTNEHSLEALFYKQSPPGPPAKGNLLLYSETVVVNNYQVDFLGRHYDPMADQTTFAYHVRGTGDDAAPALSHFTIELPDCAPELRSFDPTISTSVNFNPQTEIFGIEWHLRVESQNSEGRDYSITFPGEVPRGIIKVAVRTEDENVAFAAIAGPCAGLFDISGTVFVDTDRLGNLNTDESGIAGVTVKLTGAGGAVQYATTDARGFYIFPDQFAGNYTVEIKAVTNRNDFNEQLAESFLPTTPASRQVSIGPDSEDNIFGFVPNSEEILLDFEIGELSSDGASAKFWLQQLRFALNENGNPTVNSETLRGLLEAIEGTPTAPFFLFEPFQFGNDKFQAAFDILNNKSKDLAAQLTKELLALELNHFSGKGIVNNQELQLVLISWGESLVAATVSGGSLKFTLQETTETVSDSDLQAAIKIYRETNITSGGGTDF